MAYYHRQSAKKLKLSKAERRLRRLRARGFASEEAYKAFLRNLRATAGTYNLDSTFQATGYVGGNDDYTDQNHGSVIRALRKGDFKTVTPYARTEISSKGSSFVGIKAHYVAGKTNTYLNLCRSYTDTAPPWWGGMDVTVSLRDQLLNDTQLALTSRVRSMAPTWDVLTDVAELRGTITSLRGAAQWTEKLIGHVTRKDVRGVIRHLKLHNSKKTRQRVTACIIKRDGTYQYFVDELRPPRTVLDAMSNLWMSYRYAFMTTVYSMQDALIAFGTSSTSDKDYQYSAQVTLKTGKAFSENTGWIPSYGIGYASFKYGTILRVSGSLRMKALFSFRDSMKARLDPNTLVALTRTAWELVPYSWVADWFLGVSDYLDLLDLPSLVCKSEVCVSEKGEVYKSVYFMGVDSGPTSGVRDYTIIQAPSNGVYVGTSFYFARSKGSLSVPSWSPSETWYRWKRGLDAAALLWQNVRKSLRRAL